MESPAYPSTALRHTAGARAVSTPIVNVLWAFFNLAIGYLLLCRVGTAFNLRDTKHAVILGAGFFAHVHDVRAHFRPYMQLGM